MPNKRFTLESAVPPRDDPIEFTLGDETFRCEDDIPAAALYALLSVGLFEGTMAFLRGVVIDEHVAAFDEVVARKGRGNIVTDLVLYEVMRYLVEAYAERPTVPPSVSPGGRQATNPGSEGSSSSEAAVSQ